MLLCSISTAHHVCLQPHARISQNVQVPCAALLRRWQFGCWESALSEEEMGSGMLTQSEIPSDFSERPLLEFNHPAIVVALLRSCEGWLMSRQHTNHQRWCSRSCSQHGQRPGAHQSPENRIRLEKFMLCSSFHFIRFLFYKKKKLKTTSFNRKVILSFVRSFIVCLPDTEQSKLPASGKGIEKQ